MDQDSGFIISHHLLELGPRVLWQLSQRSMRASPSEGENTTQDQKGRGHIQPGWLKAALPDLNIPSSFPYIHSSHITYTKKCVLSKMLTRNSLPDLTLITPGKQIRQVNSLFTYEKSETQKKLTRRRRPTQPTQSLPFTQTQPTKTPSIVNHARAM